MILGRTSNVGMKRRQPADPKELKKQSKVPNIAKTKLQDEKKTKSIIEKKSIEEKLPPIQKVQKLENFVSPAVKQERPFFEKLPRISLNELREQIYQEQAEMELVLNKMIFEMKQRAPKYSPSTSKTESELNSEIQWIY